MEYRMKSSNTGIIKFQHGPFTAKNKQTKDL